MLALTASALILGGQSAALAKKLDLPALAMYWTAGYVMNPPPPQILVAIWSDGRIVWRKPQAIYDSKYNFQKGSYFEGRLDSKKVSSFIGSIEIDSLPKGGWEYAAPDIDDFHEVLRIKGRALELLVSDGLEHDFRPRDNLDPIGIKIWKQVETGVVKLTPRKGKPLSYKSAKTLLTWRDDWWAEIERRG